MTDRQILLSAIPHSAGDKIDWHFIEETLLPAYAAAMKQTPQNPLYHAEGNVWNHTKMVCECLTADKAFWACAERQRQELFLAALLHDVGKTVTTRKQNGEWTSPNHALKGANMVRELLWRTYGFCGTKEYQNFRETICGLVRYHMAAPYVMESDHAEQRLIKMAANGELAPDFTLKLLFLLSKADANGKISRDTTKSQDAALLAAELSQEVGCYEQPLTFATPYTEYACLSGKTVTPEVALYDDTEMEVIMLCGLPGTGKDTWIRVVYPDYPMISLDNIRKEHGWSPVGSQQEVVKVARAQARQLLREKRSFVWNATSLTPELRSYAINLFMQYHAYVKLVFLEAAYEENLERNARRAAMVPQSVIEGMLSKLVPPERFEAHEVTWFCV